MEKNSEIKNKIVQTYAEDMAKVIQDDREGLIKTIIHGEQEHEENKRNLSPESRKNRIFMTVGLLFILISFGTLLLFFFHKEDNTVALQKQFTPIIFNDQSTFLEVAGLNKDAIFKTVLNSVNNTIVKSGGVMGAYLTENKKVVGLRRFIDLIKANFITDSNPLLVKENFLLGVVNNENKSTAQNNGKDFFIILKVRSTADIFDALRSWENKMFFNLHEFFGVDINSNTKYLLTAEFQDGIIGNKNARILYTKDTEQTKKIVMMYIFAENDSVIITNTEDSAREIILRLLSGQIKK